MDINENKLKEILDGQRDAFQQHVDKQMSKQREEFQRTVKAESEETRHLFGIMKEDFDSKIQLIGEQYGTIKEMVGALAEDMHIVKTDIEFIKGSFRKKVDYDEFQALGTRVAMLEAKATKK
jgi:4-alpha-glucanotransferase